MRSSITVTLVTLALSAGAVCHADEWQSEPTTFRGIEFGRLLTDQFPECPKGEDGIGRGRSKTQCFTTDWLPNSHAAGSVFATVYNLNDIGAGRDSTNVNLFDGKVEKVRILFGTAFFRTVYEALRTRFGEATSLPSMPSLVGRAATWSGKSIVMHIIQYDGRQSELSVSTLAYDARVKAYAEAEKQAIKDNF